MPHEPRLIVVTGATGFLGPFVVRDLRRRFPDARLRCLVRPSSDMARLHAHGVESAVGDLRDEASLVRVFAGADTLVNLASLGFDWVEGLFSAVRQSSLRRGIFIGSTAMLTRLPVRSKLQRERAESLVRTSGLAWTILRPTMIYGTPGDRNIARLIRFVLRSPVIPIVAGQARQQPVHVEDVAAAVACALASPDTPDRAYNLAGGEALTLLQLVQETVAAVGRRRVIIRLPIGLVLSVVRLYCAVVSRPRLSVEQIRRLQEHKDFDYTDASRDFGFTPRSFRDGVREELRLIQQGADR